MKRFALIALTTLPGAAFAHPGHVDLPVPMGHDAAHMVIGATVAALAVAGVRIVTYLRRDSRKE